MHVMEIDEPKYREDADWPGRVKGGVMGNG